MRSSPGKRQSTKFRIFSKYFKCAQHFFLLFSPSAIKYRPVGLYCFHVLKLFSKYYCNKYRHIFIYIMLYLFAQLIVFLGVAGIAYIHEGAVIRLSFLISSYRLIFILLFG